MKKRIYFPILHWIFTLLLGSLGVIILVFDKEYISETLDLYLSVINLSAIYSVPALLISILTFYIQKGFNLNWNHIKTTLITLSIVMIIVTLQVLEMNNVFFILVTLPYPISALLTGLWLHRRIK